MEKEKVKKVLDFDDKQYEIEMIALKNMASTAKIFQEAWTSQPILQGTEFTLKHFQGILKNGSQFIKDHLNELVTARQEESMPGLSRQMTPQAIKLINVDEERITRTAESLRGHHPADQHRLASAGMLDVKRGKIVITDAAREQIKEKLTIYDTDPRLAHTHEILTLCASSANMIIQMMEERKEAKEKASGFKLANQEIKLFATPKPGISNPTPGPLYYSDDGRVQINLRHFL